MFVIVGIVFLVAWLLAFFSVPLNVGLPVCLAIGVIGIFARYFVGGRQWSRIDS